MSSAKKKILVVAAHPDDEVLGCGATVALRRRQGWEIHLLIMTKGLIGREKSEGEREKFREAIAKLQAEMEAAGEILGFSSVENLDFPDNRMDAVSRMDVAHAIKGKIDSVRPDAIFTHHPGDYNWDHTRTFEAVMMAARASPGEFLVREIYAFEVLSSTERSWQTATYAFMPTVYVDVKETIETKKKAMRAYETECKPYPHPRSVEGVEFLARKRGSEIGIEYAEAFALVRRIEA